jgi:hypothetical protein
MDPRRASFPREAVRDLLGVVRAIYAAAKRGGAGRGELRRIARLGTMLSRSLELHESGAPGSADVDEAWSLAESATRRVGEIVDALTPAEPIVLASGDRAFPRTKIRKKTETR